MKEGIVPRTMEPPDGPFSYAVRADNLLFVTSQVGVGKEGHVVSTTDTGAQAHQALVNLKEVVETAGGTMDDIVKLTVFITNMDERSAVGEVRAKFFKAPYPASTIVEVSRLTGPDFRVAIEAIAMIGASLKTEK